MKKPLRSTAPRLRDLHNINAVIKNPHCRTTGAKRMTVMKSSVKVLSTLVCVEFLLYTVCLCAPQWLVQPGGACEGLFALCNTYKGLSSCITFPAWMGSYSLTWMFLASSSILSLATLVAIRPALTRGRRAIVALLLNIFSIAFCVSALIAFVVSLEMRLPEMVKYLGWAFYICIATPLYASLVSVALGLVEGSSSVGPVNSLSLSPETP